MLVPTQRAPETLASGARVRGSRMSVASAQRCPRGPRSTHAPTERRSPSGLDLPDSASDSGAPRSLEVAPVTDPLIDVLQRTMALVDDPVEAKVLLPLVKKELHFRLLRSASGSMLRALANRDSHASNIARAIRTLREAFRDKLDVADLARAVGMSTSSFHRHFKAMTRTTPLQYQKDLRLAEARRLLRAGGSSVSAAAFDVGYESPSQFSREYSRRFGAAPRADLRVA